jgi:hypothetical protein
LAPFSVKTALLLCSTPGLVVAFVERGLGISSFAVVNHLEVAADLLLRGLLGDAAYD